MAEGIQGDNLEVTVYSVGTAITKLDVVPRRSDPSVMTEVEGPGAGAFTIASGDAKLTEIPNLLAYRNLVKMTRGSVVEGAFIIQGKKEDTISNSEEAGQSLTVSGEGLKTWFNDAEVYPWNGLLAGSSENRVFSWASPKGLWYKTADWKVPVKQWKYEMIPSSTSDNPWPYRPAEWPDAPEAWWIWSVKENHPGDQYSTDNPQGYNYFRYEFDTTQAGSYSVFAAGDNTLHAFIDGNNIIESDDFGSYHQTFRTDFELQPGHHVLAFKVWNNEGPGGLIASLWRAGDAAAGSAAQLISVTGGTGWVVNGYPASEPGWNIGEILLTLLSEARARGVLFPSYITPTFTASKDSAGNNWESALPWTFSTGMSYLEVLDMLEEFSTDVWIDPDDFKLYAWNKRGVDRSVQTSTAEPVQLREGYNLRSARETGQADIKNTLMLQTNDGWVEVVPDDPTSIQKYGRIEGHLSTNANLSVSKQLAKRVFEQKALEEESAEYVLLPREGAWPLRDFQVGDWVLAPNRRGEMVKRRVMSITASETTDNGDAAYAIEFDTIFKDSETRLQKLLSIASGGGLGGGFANGSTPTSTVGTPTTTPLGGPIQSRPGKPVGLTAESEGKWNEGGGPYSVVTLDWEPGANSGQVTYYEILGRLTARPADELTTLTTVSGRTAVQVSPLQPNQSWTFYVRASIGMGRLSELSDPVEHVTAMPNTVMDAPSKPTLATAYGTATVSWDGLTATGLKMPYQFSYVYALVSESENGTYAPVGSTINAEGSIAATGLIVNKQYWFALKAVDRIGIESVLSQAAAITIEGIDTDALEGEIRDELESVRTAADDAKAAAGVAQAAAQSADSKAGTAQTAADKAIADALAASGLAGSKGRVIFQPSEPTGANASSNNLWIRSSDNKPFTYNGTSWVEATDKVATDAAAAAVAAKAAADKAASDAAAAAVAAGNAQTTADGKNRVWYQDTAPSGTAHKAGDTWFNTADGNKISRWDGSTWVLQALGSNALADGAVGTSKLADAVKTTISNAQAAATAADSKAGTAQTAADQAKQDAAAAAGIANGKAVVLFQSATPSTAQQVATTLWIDTTGGLNTPKRWSGSAWVAVTDKAATDAASAAAAAQSAATKAGTDAAAAATAAGNAQTSADSKNRVWYQATAPAGTAHKVNDTWFNTSDGNKMSSWSGTQWVLAPFNTAALVDGAITASKLATSVNQSIVDANAAATAAKAVADAADAKALAAAGLVSGKGRIWYQGTAPASGTTHGWDGAVGNSASVKRLDGALIRRNRMFYPNEPGAGSFGGGTGTSATLGGSGITGGPDQFVRKTWTTASTSVGNTGVVGRDRFSVTPGETITVSGWLRTSSTTRKSAARAKISWVGGAGDLTTDFITLVPGVWSRTSVTRVVPAGITQATAVLSVDDGLNWSAGDTLDGTGFLVENTATPGDYFDGYFPDDRSADLWINTANGNRPSRWNTTTDVWEAFVDQGIIDAANVAASANAVAQAKGRIWSQPTAPPAGLARRWAGTADESPSIESLDGVEKRRNLINYPRSVVQARVGISPGTGGATTNTLVSRADMPSGGAYGIEWTSASTGAWNLNLGRALTGIEPGATYMVSMYGLHTWEGSLTQITMEFRDSSDGFLGYFGQNAQVIPANKVTRLSAAFTAPAGAAYANVFWDANGGERPPKGGKAFISSFLAEKGTVLGNYFDGTFADDRASDLWLDTANGNRTSRWNSDTDSWQVFVDQRVTDAANAAFAAQQTADNAVTASALNRNPHLDDWTGSYPTHWQNWVGNPPTKETTLARSKPYAVRFTAQASDTGIQYSPTLLADLPVDLPYVVVELDVILVSGTSLSGAGVLLDWSGRDGGNRGLLRLDEEIPNPQTGKVYRVTKTISRKGTGKATSWATWLMANYGELGTLTVKDVVYDRIVYRPATNEEIRAIQGQAAAAVAQQTADGKNTVTYSTVNPDNTPGTRPGDIWFVRNATTGIITLQFEWTGTAWQARILDNAVIANLDAGKLTAGTISTDRLGANSITATKIAIGDFTDYVPDPIFSRGIGTLAGTRYAASDPVAPAGAPAGSYVVNMAQAYDLFATDPNGGGFAVKPGDKFFVSARVRYTGASSSAVLQMRLWTSSANQAYGDNTMDWGYPGFLVPKGSPGMDGVAPDQGWTTVSGIITIPPTGSTGRNLPQFFAWAGLGPSLDKFWWITDWHIRRMTTGELIVDGSVTASKILAGTITAESGIIADAAITNAKIANVDAGKLTAGTIDAARIGAGSITSDHIATRTIVAEDLAANTITANEIATGTITAASGIIASLDAGKITTGTIDAARIAALSITSDKIFVGNNTNILVGGDMESSVAFGNIPSGRVSLATALSHTGGRSLTISAGTTASTHPTTPMTVVAGDRITAGFWVYMDSLYSMPSTTNRVEYQDQNGTRLADFTFSSTVTEQRNVWVQLGQQFPFTIPTGVTSIRAVLNVTTTTQAGQIWLDDFTIIKAGKGALVVDGSIMVDGTISGTKIISNSITADQIKANSITAVQIAAGTIEANNIKSGTLTTTQLAANSVLASNLAADAITAKHTITGATIRTAATGARTEMTTAGLRVVGADGTDKVRLGFGLETGMAVQQPGTTNMIPLAPLVLGTKAWQENFGPSVVTGGESQGWGNWINPKDANQGVFETSSPTGRFLILTSITAPVNSQQNYTVNMQAGFYFPKSSMSNDILAGLETQQAFAACFANGEQQNTGLEVITLVANRIYNVRPIFRGKSFYGGGNVASATSMRIIVIPL
jgi:hypothetical protein